MRLTGSQTWAAVVLMLNIGVSVSIVLVNKWIYTQYSFPNMTLTCLHFLITSLGMEIARRKEIFLFKSLPMKEMVVLSCSFNGFVVLTNMSLQANTVGTYQISKFMTTPCVMLLQIVFYQKSFPPMIHVSIIPICLGVFLNNYNDLKLTAIGVTYATAGVLVTSLYQVWVGAKQHELQANSMQLLYYQAPLSALGLLVLIPFTEPVFSQGGVFGQLWSPYVMGAVLLSGCLAFLVNLTIFWVIGNTSPLTYNMAGHLKFCLISTGGFFLFHELPSLDQFIGIVLTISGVSLYTYIKLQESSRTVTKPALSA